MKLLDIRTGNFRLQLWDDKVRNRGKCWKPLNSIAIIIDLSFTLKFRDSAASVDFGGGGEYKYLAH